MTFRLWVHHLYIASYILFRDSSIIPLALSTMFASQVKISSLAMCKEYWVLGYILYIYIGETHLSIVTWAVEMFWLLSVYHTVCSIMNWGSTFAIWYLGAICRPYPCTKLLRVNWFSVRLLEQYVCFFAYTGHTYWHQVIWAELGVEHMSVVLIVITWHGHQNSYLLCYVSHYFIDRSGTQHTVLLCLWRPFTGWDERRVFLHNSSSPQPCFIPK